jgi:tetratricopeptide (TPR) repeat protein
VKVYAGLLAALGGVILVVAGGYAGLPHGYELPLAVGVPLALYVAWAARREILWRRLLEALAALDAGRLRERIEALRGAPGIEPQIGVLEIAAFALERKLDEARSRLPRIDALPTRRARTLYRCHVANAFLHVGDVATAERLADAAAAEAKGADQAYVLALRGVIDVARGRPAEAEERLRASLDRPGSPMHMTGRLYHLGRALEAQGRSDDAAGAYRAALRAARAPHKVHIEDALTRLAAKPPYR